MYSVQSPPPVGSASVASVSSDVIPTGYTAIYTAEDLQNINNDLSGKYILMNDIDLSGITDWTPIGNNALFKGTFDGNGHVIKNLKQTPVLASNGDAAVGGLFLGIDNATVKNLGIDNIQTKSNVYGVSGGLTGFALSSTISNCYVTGTIEGNCA